MYIKQLINDPQQYWEFVWPFLDWANNHDRSLWHEEDYPKLKPFFDIQAQRSPAWTPEVVKAFAFYEKCRMEYGDKNAELRDAVSRLSPEDILDAFGYEIPEYNEDEDFQKDKPLSLNKDFKSYNDFPFIVVGDINCDHDRMGEIKVLSLHMVSLIDFARLNNA